MKKLIKDKKALKVFIEFFNFANIVFLLYFFGVSIYSSVFAGVVFMFLLATTKQLKKIGKIIKAANGSKTTAKNRIPNN